MRQPGQPSREKDRAPKKPAFKGRGQEESSKEAVEGPLWNPRPKGGRHFIREQVPSVPHQEIRKRRLQSALALATRICVSLVSTALGGEEDDCSE